MENEKTLIDAIHESFGRAIENEENILDDGSINWDFVSADVFMDMAEPTKDGLFFNGNDEISATDLQTQIDMLIDGHLDDEVMLPSFMEMPEFPTIRKPKADDLNWSQKAEQVRIASGNRHERRVRARLLKKQKKAS